MTLARLSGLVIMLAISLVRLRNMPNGPVVPAARPTATSDAVPTYYTELRWIGSRYRNPASR